jgi:hypothetical protein
MSPFCGVVSSPCEPVSTPEPTPVPVVVETEGAPESGSRRTSIDFEVFEPFAFDSFDPLFGEFGFADY